MNFDFSFHPTTSIQAEVMTPLHLLGESEGVFTAGTVSPSPTKLHVLLLARPSSLVLKARTLPEASGFSALPVEIGSISSNGSRIGYLFKSSWTAVNILSGLLYVSGSWWESTPDVVVKDGEFPMLFKNADFSVFSAQNKTTLIVCGEITSHMQDLLRL